MPSRSHCRMLEWTLSWSTNFFFLQWPIIPLYPAYTRIYAFFILYVAFSFFFLSLFQLLLSFHVIVIFFPLWCFRCSGAAQMAAYSACTRTPTCFLVFDNNNNKIVIYNHSSVYPARICCRSGISVIESMRNISYPNQFFLLIWLCIISSTLNKAHFL